jgi:hypothetical protein
LKDRKNATAYQTKVETVFGDFPEKANWNSNIIANGEPLIKTYKDKWYVVKGELTSLEEVWIEKTNKRYELINKDLYNEKIPLIIDESTREKFQALIDNNLYKTVYDEKEVRQEIPFDVIEIDLDISIELKTMKKFRLNSSAWYSDQMEHYIISLIEHNIVEQCLIPRPLLDLTRPCVLKGRLLFMVLTDMVSSRKPNNYRITENTDNYFKVMDINKTKCFLSWEYYDHKAPHNIFDSKAILANNYGELIEKLNAFVEYLIQKLTENNGDDIKIALDELTQGKDFRR